MATTEEFDCIVIGAGVQGSFTAYQLAKKNQRTLLLEQFVLPHTRGSSHGQTRIIRKAYEQDYYTTMMDECYQLWAQLEKEAGVKLYRQQMVRSSQIPGQMTLLILNLFSPENIEIVVEDEILASAPPHLADYFLLLFGQTGLLVTGPENGEHFQQIKKTLERNKVPMVVFNQHNFSQHIPHFNLSEGTGALVDVTAGVLYADRALKTAQDQFRRLGGILRDKEKVMDIKPGPVVTVTTSAGVYRATRLVVTAGPWTNPVLLHTGLQLPLQVQRINVCYWKEKVPGSYDVNRRFPCFVTVESEEANVHIYGLPSNEYPGLMKICYHTGSDTEPDQRDQQTDKSDIDILRRYISRCLPGLVPEPAVVESCLYTLTPDHHFVLDYHPTYNNIVIGAGFSGHGFKFGPIIGKLLSQLIMGDVPSYDLSPFRLKRFQGSPKAAL